MTRMQPLQLGELIVARLASYGRLISTLIQRPIAEPSFVVSAEVSNVITIGIQLRDRHKRPVVGRWPIDLWVTTAEDGAPSATGNTVAVTTGTTMQVYTANAAYRILTDETGLAAITVTIAGAATRYIYATIGGEAFASPELTWAA